IILSVGLKTKRSTKPSCRLSSECILGL
ncbi:uncharacterized protein METZ01_LOCUS276732, partial [marine metagenome]